MSMRVGFAQFSPVFGNPVQNLEKIKQAIATTSAELLVFPELCLTGYAFANKTNMEKVYALQQSTNWFNQLQQSSQSYEIALLLGFIEKEGKTFYNSAIFIQPNGEWFVYRKTHLFFREPELFAAGNTGPLLVEWKGVKYGIGICLDYLYPEYWRKLALMGADVFLLPSNLVTDNGQPLMNARSRENKVYSLIANRIGTEKGITFCGKSQIIDPNGNILVESMQEEMIAVTEINVKLARDKHLLTRNGISYNDIFGGRRLEMYGEK